MLETLSDLKDDYHQFKQAAQKRNGGEIVDLKG